MTGAVSLAAAQGVVFLADWGNKDLTGGRGEEFGKASPIGLLLILALLAGIALLMRSMNRHLRKVPKSFDGDAPAEGGSGGDGGADGSGEGGDGPAPDGPVATGPAPADGSAGDRPGGGTPPGA